MDWNILMLMCLDCVNNLWFMFVNYFIPGDCISGPCRAYCISEISWRNLTWPQIFVPWCWRGESFYSLLNLLSSLTRSNEEGGTLILSGSSRSRWMGKYTKKTNESNFQTTTHFFPPSLSLIVVFWFIGLCYHVLMSNFMYLAVTGRHWHSRTDSPWDSKTG